MELVALRRWWQGMRGRKSHESGGKSSFNSLKQKRHRAGCCHLFANRLHGTRGSKGGGTAFPSLPFPTPHPGLRVQQHPTGSGTGKGRPPACQPPHPTHLCTPLPDKPCGQGSVKSACQQKKKAAMI